MITIEFRRMGEHTIKCLISEDEVKALGYSMEEIVSNGSRAQEFMNYIFDMAEQEFNTKFNLGVKTVQMEYYSDQMITLTFSDHPMDEVVGHLRELIGGMLGSLSPDKLKELEDLAAEEDDKNEENDSGEEIIFAFVFSDIEQAVRFAKRVQLEEMPMSELFRYKDKLYIIVDSMGFTNKEIRSLVMMAEEFDIGLEFGNSRMTFILEHGTHLIDSGAALNCLRKL